MVQNAFHISSVQIGALASHSLTFETAWQFGMTFAILFVDLSWHGTGPFLSVLHILLDFQQNGMRVHLTWRQLSQITSTLMNLWLIYINWKSDWEGSSIFCNAPEHLRWVMNTNNYPLVASTCLLTTMTRIVLT